MHLTSRPRRLRTLHYLDKTRTALRGRTSSYSRQKRLHFGGTSPLRLFASPPTRVVRRMEIGHVDRRILISPLVYVLSSLNTRVECGSRTLFLAWPPRRPLCAARTCRSANCLSQTENVITIAYEWKRRVDYCLHNACRGRIRWLNRGASERDAFRRVEQHVI
ncbi:hypothetical protein BV25DRAFT_177439 [Artomyces pyxidatus]|uniref:Uncharacterized protein n=1 Tax=Artomyces pyxidatus TaxID=48021 RepID=A0ACB8SG71_9AGAM|nr:hypothetical protein BV25DRAFT_177439 [Artomyces pyxidatus]